MKDILITLISLLLTAVVIICMVRGIAIGQFEVLSISEIKLNSLELDQEIEELNNLKNVTYKKKLSDLESSVKDLTNAKQKYLDLASVSTDAEIQQANQEQTYAMEFLWNKVGSYATQEGVTLKWDVSSTGTNNKYTLNFTTTGSYIGIINYIYAIENDAELSFRIENFKMVAATSTASASGTTSSQNDVKVTGTFTVNNIAIKPETVTSVTNDLNSTVLNNSTSTTTSSSSSSNTESTTSSNDSSSTNTTN